MPESIDLKTRATKLHHQYQASSNWQPCITRASNESTSSKGNPLNYEDAVEALKYRDLTMSADFTKQHKTIRKNTQG